MRTIILLCLMSMLISCNKRITVTEKFFFDDANRIIIEAETLDSTYCFVFDTGSTITSVTNKSLKPSGEQRKVIVPSLDTAYMLSIMRNADFSIDPLSFNIDLGYNDTALIPNVIGYDIIQQAYWLFDLAEQVYSVSNKAILTPTHLAKYAYIDYVVEKKTMVHIGKTARMFIDTGWSSSFSIEGQSEVYEKHIGVLNMQWWDDFIEREKLTKDNEFIILTSVGIGTAKFEDQRMFQAFDSSPYYRENQGDLDHDVVLTMNALKQFRYIYIDPHKQRLYLKK